MANERLSKLQKWILTESYKLNILHDDSTVKNTRKLAWYGDRPYSFYEHWVYEYYYQLIENGYSYTHDYNKAHVTVCRAIQNMELKGLITVTHYLGYCRTHWKITQKGIDMIRETKGQKNRDSKRPEC